MKSILTILSLNIIFSCSNAQKANPRPNQGNFNDHLKRKNNLDTTIQSVIDYIDNGNYSIAINNINYQLTKRKDSFSFLYFYRGVSFYKLKDDQNAKQSFIQSLQNNHQDARIYGWLGDACQRLNELDSAIIYYTAGINKLGQDPYILNNLGALYVTQKEFEKAVGIFEILVKSDSLNVDYSFNLAQSYYRMRNFEKAYDLVQKYKKSFPNEYGFYNLEGSIYAKQGQFEEARKSWEKSLSLRPNNNNAAENIRRLPN